MKYLKPHWRYRLLVILLVSCVIGTLMITLEITSWAEQINQLGYSHGEAEGEGGKRDIPQVMLYILPFIKELVLIGIPMLLTLLWIKLFRKLKGAKKFNG